MLEWGQLRPQSSGSTATRSSIFFNASADISEYKDDHSEHDFVAFVNKNAGIKRAAGGRLAREASRISQLDTLTQKIAQASNPEKKRRLSAEGIQLAKDPLEKDNNAQRYVHVFEKAAVGSTDYLQSEMTRLSKSTASENKIDDLSVRHNILAAFSVDTAAAPKEEL
jgi:hypothetical protein